MNLKEIDQIVRKARREKKTLVLNFKAEEVIFADLDWIVLELGKDE